MLRLLCNNFYSLNRVPNKRLAFLFYVRKFFLFPYSELHSSTYIKVHKNVIHTYYFLQFFPHFYSHLSSRLCIPSITDGVHHNENLVEIIPVFSTFSNFFKKKKKKIIKAILCNFSMRLLKYF